MGAAAPSPDTPLVVVGRHGSRRLVTAADQAAQRAGLRVGMAAAHAQALVPDLAAHDADGAGDAEALDRLALWALRYSPVVAADPPDGLVIDASGATNLHGGEVALLRDMIERLEGAGFASRAAFADSWGAAHAVARFAADPLAIVPPSQNAAAMATLPLAALRLPPDVLDGLRILGFETVGDLASTPRAPLALRFGPEPGRRLEQALGAAAEPIEPARPDDIVEVRELFGEPIAATETIVRYVGKLAGKLCAELELRGLGARRLDLLLQRVDNRLETVRVGTAVPVRDARRIGRLLSDRIDAIDPGFGIEQMRLAATLAEPLDHRQTIASLIEEPEADITSLIDTLSNRVGEERLYRVASVASDVPERSVRRIAPAAPDTGEAWPDHWPRPARLFHAPEAIEAIALLPDHPPASFTWRGTRHRVKRADGPERVFGEWWRRDAELEAVRDYFRVENEAGERFWIFRAGDGEDPATGSHRWFLHGIFA